MDQQTTTITDVKSLLTIKVLRLIKPTLVGPLALTADPHDLVGDLWHKELRSDVTAVQGIESLSLGNFLRLPQGFGNMYLGETFASYVVIQNESPILVGQANCKIELQTSTQKFVLADNRTVTELKPGQTIDIVMHHEVKELGKHMLIVTLSYTVPSAQLTNQNPNEPIVLERYFKFQVKKPLDVKTKLYNSESDEVFLQAEVQNITSAPIYLEKVDMEPSQYFNCTPLTSQNPQLMTQNPSTNCPLEINSKTSWPYKMLDVDDAVQFLYRLSRNSEELANVNIRGAPTNIGKLDIVWRTYLGDRGRLQTSHLVRQPLYIPELRVTVVDIPEIVSVDKPFEIKLQIQVNPTTATEMDLELDLDNLPETWGYCWIGLTKMKIGILGTNSVGGTGSTKILTLNVFPIRTGLINLTGVRLVDLKNTNRKTDLPFVYYFNELAQVFVVQQE